MAESLTIKNLQILLNAIEEMDTVLLETCGRSDPSILVPEDQWSEFKGTIDWISTCIGDFPSFDPGRTQGAVHTHFRAARARILFLISNLEPISTVPPATEEIINQDHAASKKTRQSKAPNYDLLKNQNATLTRIQAANALGMSPRNFDRLKAQKKVVPVGPKNRKRYQVKDLLYFMHQRH